jgi:hypothetical protein
MQGAGPKPGVCSTPFLSIQFPAASRHVAVDAATPPHGCLAQPGAARTAQHSTAQHSTAQHSTAQHSTAQQHPLKPVLRYDVCMQEASPVETATKQPVEATLGGDASTPRP